MFEKIKALIQNTFKLSEKEYTFFSYLVIIVLVNVVSLTLYTRLDLTKNSTYSLSKKSREVVQNLQENLTVRVLFSEDLPARYNSVYNYLMDLLEEYDNAGNKYFKYKVITGEDLQKEARSFGIQQLRVQQIEKNEAKVKNAYMGLVIQHANLVEKINGISDPQGLEFLITSRIEKMSAKISSLLSLKKNIKLKLILDSRLKLMGIQGLGDLDSKVKAAVEKANKRNYNRIKFEYIDTSKDEKLAKEYKQYGLQELNWKQMKTQDGKIIKAGSGLMGIILQTGKRIQKMNIQLQQKLDLFRGRVVYAVSGLDKLDDTINESVGRLLSSYKKIAFITGHDEVKIDGGGRRRRRRGTGLRQILSEMYNVQIVDLSKKDIPDDVGVIVIAGPKKEYSDYEIFKIDQHLMKGRSAIFLVDSFYEARMPNRMRMMGFGRQQTQVLPLKTGLNPLLKHFGITINKNIVLDKNSHKANTRMGMVDYYIAPVIKRSGLNRDNVITRYLNSLLFLKGSSITINEKKSKDMKVVKLVNSSDESWLMTGRMDFGLRGMMMQKMKKDIDYRSYNLVSYIEGTFDSYFKGKSIPAPEVKDKKKKQQIQKQVGNIKTVNKLDKTVKSGKSRIIVAGTSEIIKGGFLANAGRALTKGFGNSMGNVNFIHHMIDYLSGNTFVPEMKSKSLDFNPLRKMTYKQELIFQIINIVLLPIIVVIIGLIIWRRRNKRKKRLMQEYAGGN